MTAPIRILHVFGRMNRGGAELRTLEMMEALDRTRFHFEFCALSGAPGSLDARIRALGGEVHPCRLDARFPWRFRELLHKSKPDIVHSHVHLASGYVLRLASLFGFRRGVAHFRSMSDGRAPTLRRHLQAWYLRRWIDQHASAILAVSEGAMTHGWSPTWSSDPRCQVLYSGINPARFGTRASRTEVLRGLGIAARARVCAHVGSMQAAKNHERLLEIFCTLARDEKDAELLLIGRTDPDIEASLRSMAEAEQLAGRIHFLGERSDVPQLLHVSDVMIFPSIREGLPGAVVEALATGLPVVASDLPGISEIGRHLAGLTQLELSAPTALWARAVAEQLKNPRVERLNQLTGSVFDVARSTIAHCAVWQELMG